MAFRTLDFIFDVESKAASLAQRVAAYNQEARDYQFVIEFALAVIAEH